VAYTGTDCSTACPADRAEEATRLTASDASAGIIPGCEPRCGASSRTGIRHDMHPDTCEPHAAVSPTVARLRRHAHSCDPMVRAHAERRLQQLQAQLTVLERRSDAMAAAVEKPAEAASAFRAPMPHSLRRTLSLTHRSVDEVSMPVWQKVAHGTADGVGLPVEEQVAPAGWRQRNSLLLARHTPPLFPPASAISGLASFTGMADHGRADGSPGGIGEPSVGAAVPTPSRPLTGRPHLRPQPPATVRSRHQHRGGVVLGAVGPHQAQVVPAATYVALAAARRQATGDAAAPAAGAKVPDEP